MPLNEPNSLGIQFNWLNLCGIFSIHGNALCSCAEQMPMFPAASLIMTGIVVIELLSHCCACAELHSLTGACFCQRALGRRVAVDGKRPSNHSSPSKSTNYTLLNHLWSPLFSPKKKKLHRNTSYPLGCTFFKTSSPSWTWSFLLLPGKTWTKMSSSAFVRLSLSCPSNRCLWMSHPSCVLEQILRGSNDC